MGARDRSFREITTRTDFLIAGALILGLMLIASTGGFDELTFRSVFRQVGNFLIATVVLALLWERFAKQSLLREIRTMFKISEGLHESGITAIEISHEWIRSTKGAKRVDILFACSEEESCPGVHDLEEIAQEMQQYGGVVRVFLPDFGTNEVCTLLGHRVNKRAADVKRDLIEHKNAVCLAVEKTPKIRWEIYLVKRALHFSYLRSDGIVYVWLSKPMSGGRKAPLLTFCERGEQFDFFTRELEAIRENHCAGPVTCP